MSGARIEDECNSCICEGGVLSCSSGIKETCFRSNGGEVITQFDGEVEGGCKVRPSAFNGISSLIMASITDTRLVALPGQWGRCSRPRMAVTGASAAMKGCSASWTRTVRTLSRGRGGFSSSF